MLLIERVTGKKLSIIFYWIAIWIVISSLKASAQSELLNSFHVEKYFNIAILPFLSTDVQCKQFSSHDQQGSNDDGFNNTYGTLYMENNEYVLFDHIGPGCLLRIWTTFKEAPEGRIRFYINNETSPRLDIQFSDLFTGTHPPFLFPFVGDKYRSSGGYYCYYPISFNERLKITTTFPPGFFHFTYHSFNTTKTIPDYNGNENLTDIATILTQCGLDPKSSSNQHLYGSMQLSAGQTGMMGSISGKGCINQILIKSGFTQSQLNNLWIRMYWDRENIPSVNVPLGEFFGSYEGETTLRSLPLGSSCAAQPTYWHGWYGGTNYLPFGGDVTGDGKADLLSFSSYYPGKVMVLTSTGHLFLGYESWVSSFHSSKNVVVGDFDGDLKSDILHIDENGDIEVALSNGRQFGTPMQWYAQFPCLNCSFFSGDVNSDGKDDLIALKNSGDIYTAISSGNGFEDAKFHQRQSDICFTELQTIILFDIFIKIAYFSSQL